MDEGLKQRLVGAAVLVALAVTFVPMLLETQNGSDNFEVRFGKPAEPEVDYLVPVPQLRTVDLPAQQTPARVIDKTAAGKAEAKPTATRQKTVDRSQARTVQKKQAAGKTTSSRPLPKKAATKPDVSKQTSTHSAASAKTAPVKVATSRVEREKRSQSRPMKKMPEPSTAPARTEAVKPRVMERNDTDVAPVEERIAAPTDTGLVAGNGLTGWAVQLGSFSDQTNAMKLRDKLRAANFTTYVEDVTSVKTGRYRVRAGPVTSKSRASELRKRIKQALGMDSLLVRY